MKKVAVMTDSVSYMPKQVVEENDITLLPTHVIIDGKSHYENEIDLAWFYQHMPKWKKEDRIPTTSSPSTDDFVRAYRRLSEQYEGIVYLAYSAKLGMAVSASSQAKALVQDELSKTQIEVVDCQTACSPQMLATLEVARAANAGQSFTEVVKVARSMTEKVNFIALMDNLYYLAKGGRIHRARPWAASKITNSVLLHMNVATNGEMSPLARCKTKGELLKTLFSVVKERSGGRKLHVAINHADVPAEAEELREKALANFPVQEIYVSEIGPLVTSHTGLGTRIFGWWAED
ncbi:MAG: DegV family protein [Dehalococcoidales bacterium]|nr:DegV family protein [Dehalococcoidales bacterium]